MRRIYYLEGRKIPSNECQGFLHTAQKDKSEECASCLEPIKAGQEYIELNQYAPYIFHKDCYLADHYLGESIVLGVRTKKMGVFPNIWIKKRVILCERFIC